MKPIQGARILLVEDNEINQQVARELLEQEKLVVEVAYHGQQALDMLAEHQYDCVLMDIQMPVMDGYSATQKIREDRRFDKLPVLAMTANATVEDRERSLSAGMNAHLNKPIDPRELYSALLSWIQPGEREVPAGLGESMDDDGVDDGALSIPGIDTDTGINRVGGNPARYRKLLRKFIDNQAGAVDDVINAMGLGDNEGAVRAAHTLKGVGGSIGAGELQRLGAELEQGLKESPEVNFDTLLTAIRAELQRVIGDIEAALGTGETSGAAPAKVMQTDLQERLQVLAVQLTEYSGEAGDTLDRLIDEVGDPQILAELERLGKLVDQYDYDGAQALVEQLMA